MKTPISFILSVLLLVSSIANASSFLGKAPESGIIISVNPEKTTSKSGESVLISGTIKHVKKSQSNKGKDDNEDESGRGDKKHGLLEAFKAQGIDIVGTFPSSAVDISSELTLESVSKDEIRFFYSSKDNTADDLNQFSLKVYNNHTNKGALKKLSVIQAKLERRLQLLANLKKKFASSKATKEAIAAIEKEIAKLSAITAKIAQKLNTNENLMAETTYALQVDNLTSNYSKISTVMNDFRFMVNSDIGSVIHGMKVNFKSQIVSLSRDKDDDDRDDDNDNDDGYLAEFYFNDQKLSSQKVIKSRKNVDVVFDYPTEKLNPANTNIFSIALYRFEDGVKGRRIGYLNYKVPVVADMVKPIWLSEAIPNHQDRYTQQLRSISLKAQDSFGRVDPATFKLLLNSQSTTKDLSGSISSTKSDDGATYEFTGNLNPLDEGEYTLAAHISDFAENAADAYNVTFRIDRTVPQIQLQLSNTILTNKTKIEVPVLVNDLSPTTTSIYVNGIPVMYSLEKTFTAEVGLGNEGYNSIQVISVDAAGNSNISNEVFINRDTIAPKLAMITPLENEYVNGVQFNISVLSNEEVVTASVNEKALQILSDKVTLQEVYTSLSDENLTLNITATDKAGNTGYLTTNVKVLLKALNPSLVGLYPNEATGKVLIKGAIAATRPFLEVKASSSFLNSRKVIASEKGEFLIEMDVASKYTVEVYDPITNETLSADFNFGAGPYILSGTVRDTDGKPLTGATVSIQGTPVVAITDANGVFEFLRSSYPQAVVSGDQMLVVDGSTISVPDDGIKRKFSKTSLAIGIGLKQSNVLQRPIYLAPIYLDGSATEIVAASGGQVSDIHAPGVTLDIPAGAVVFPNGQDIEKISLIEIPTEVATVEVPDFAVPKTVIALEPSGTTFNEPVQLTLPNTNEFPPHTDMVVMLMNSKTGRWELGGMAEVSSDGQSVVTKEAQGIKHFSLAFATIPGPTKLPIGSQEKPGADTFNGAVTTQIKLPSTKIMGQDVSPGLVYKSTWAKPSLLVTNMFDFPMNSIKLEPQVIVDNNGNVQQGREKIRHCWKVDKITGWTECIDKEFDYYYKTTYITQTSELEAVIKPKKVTSYLLTENLKSEDYVFEASAGNEFPRMSAVSYKMDLKDSEGKYLNTGIYPYYADFKIEFSGLIIKGNAKSWATTTGQVDGRNVFNVTVQNKDFSLENELVENMGVETQSLSNTYIVQNKINSEAGAGWKIGGVQKILNPSAQRIAVEEADGAVTTYSLQNTVETLIDGDLSQVNFHEGAGINNYPNIIVKAKGKDELTKFDLNQRDSQGQAVPQNFSKFSEYKSTLLGLDYLNWKRKISFVSTRQNFCFHQYYDYTFGTKPIQMLFDGNVILGIDKIRQTVFSVSNNTNESIVVGQNTTAFRGGINFNYAFPTYSSPGGDYPGPIFHEAQISSYCNSTEGIACSTGRNVFRVNYNGHYDVCNTMPSYDGGKRPYFGSVLNGQAALNNPQGIAIKPNSNQVYVADTGNNRVLLVDYITKVSSIFAGNQNTIESGDGGIATAAGINHPQGVAADQYGNVYISTETGYIRKVNSQGIINTIAGNVSGTITESGDALTMKLINPKGLVVDDQKGILYIADYGGNRIFALHLETGQMQAVAGNGSNSGSSNSALDTAVVAPKLLALDQNKNLLFTSDATNRLQRVNFQNVSNGTVAFASVKEDNSKLYKYANNMWARVYRDGTISRFDELGRHLSDKNKIGNEVRYEYDGTSSRLTRVTYPTGQKSEFIYSGELLDEIIDPAGRSTSFEYSDNKLTKVIYPDGNTKRYEYTVDGILTKEYNENNAGLEYVYNNLERLSKYVPPNGAEISFEDQVFMSLKDPSQPKSLKDLANIVTDSSSNTTTIEKDYRGYIFSIKDREGKITKTIRDEKGRVVKVERPDGTTAEFNYDAVYGDLVKSIDTATGNSIEVRYDQYGHEIYKKDSLGYITQNIFNASTGLLDKTVLPDLSEISYQYDSRGLLIKKTIALQNGNIAEEVYEHDSKGNITKRSVAGKANTFELDASGNILKGISEKETGVFVTTQYQYDLMNRVVSVTSPNLEKTSYVYSKTGQLAEIIDPKENLTKFNYDVMEQLVEKIDPEGLSTKMTYDKSGNLQTKTDPNGNVATYTYTKTNKIKTLQLPDDFISYEYSDNEQLDRITNIRSVINYHRDAKGRVDYESINGIGDLTGYPLVEQSFDFDANDNIANSTLAVNSISVESIAMTYDRLNRLKTMRSSSFGDVGFEFDKMSRLLSVNLGNISYTNNFSARHELAGIKYIKNSDSSPLQEFGFSYDERNYIMQKRMLASVRSAGSPETGSLQQAQLEYSYDKNGQLTGVSSLDDSSLNESFSYDPLGNRLTDKHGNYVYDNQKQKLQEDSQYFYLYDNNGNILYKNSKDNAKLSYQYEYSSTNQLRSVRVLQKTVSSPLGEVIKEVFYKYDVLGRRLRKDVVDHVNRTDLKKNYKINFIYQGENIALELDANDNVILAQHYHSPLKSDEILKSSYTERAKDLGFVKSSGVFTYIKDHLGTVTELVDNNGNVKQRYSYTSYGVLRSISSGDGSQDITLNPEVKPYFTYTGREWDSEVGLYYSRARYYDANIGRFLQKDPDPGKLTSPNTFLSKYSYGANMPTMATDPTGKAFFIPLMIFLGKLVVSAVVSGLIAGTISGLIAGAISKGPFWDAFASAFVTGFVAGAAGGAIGFAAGGIAAAAGAGAGTAQVIGGLATGAYGGYSAYEATGNIGWAILGFGFGYISGTLSAGAGYNASGEFGRATGLYNVSGRAYTTNVDIPGVDNGSVNPAQPTYRLPEEFYDENGLADPDFMLRLVPIRK